MSDSSENTLLEEVPPNAQCGVYLLMEQCGRQLVGFVVMDEDGPIENSWGYVKVTNPLQLFAQARPDGVAVSLQPPAAMVFVKEMHVRVSSFSECPKPLMDKYAKDVLRHQEQIQGGSLIQCAAAVSPEDLAAAAAVDRMKVK